MKSLWSFSSLLFVLVMMLLVWVIHNVKWDVIRDAYTNNEVVEINAPQATQQDLLNQIKWIDSQLEDERIGEKQQGNYRKQRDAIERVQGGMVSETKSKVDLDRCCMCGQTTPFVTEIHVCEWDDGLPAPLCNYCYERAGEPPTTEVENNESE